MDFTSHIYPADSILRAVHLVVPPWRPDWKSLKLMDLEFANSIPAPEGTRISALLALNALGNGGIIMREIVWFRMSATHPNSTYTRSARPPPKFPRRNCLLLLPQTDVQRPIKPKMEKAGQRCSPTGFSIFGGNLRRILSAPRFRSVLSHWFTATS